MKRDRTVFERIIVSLWDIVVFCGVGTFALELPSILSETFGIDLNTFTVQVLILVGFIALWGKSKDIKAKEAQEEAFYKLQNALKQQNENHSA